MKYGVPQVKISGQVLFNTYTLTIQYKLNYRNVSFNFNPVDTQICFNLDGKCQCVSKLNTVYHAVHAVLIKGKLTLKRRFTVGTISKTSLHRKSNFLLQSSPLIVTPSGPPKSDSETGLTL